jgi:hypothetical protein
MNKTNNSHFSELLDWLEGRLPPDEALAVADRLKAADAATQADLDWLRLFLEARRFLKLSSPPPSVRETLKQRFAAHAEARQQPPGLFRRWLAALTYDSRTQLVTTGLRSATDDKQQRQIIYSTEAAEIALTIHSAIPEKKFHVTGQIFPMTDAPSTEFSIQLLRDASEVALTRSDELGEFTFADLPVGKYDIVASTGQYEVVIPSIHIQP